VSITAMKNIVEGGNYRYMIGYMMILIIHTHSTILSTQDINYSLIALFPMNWSG